MQYTELINRATPRGRTRQRWHDNWKKTYESSERTMSRRTERKGGRHVLTVAMSRNDSESWMKGWIDAIVFASLATYKRFPPLLLNLFVHAQFSLPKKTGINCDILYVNKRLYDITYDIVTCYLMYSNWKCGAWMKKMLRTTVLRWRSWCIKLIYLQRL